MASETLPFQYTILCAGSSACFADLVTFPLDTAKVRLQIQGEGRAMLVGGSEVVIEGAAAQYRGLVGTLTTIARNEGARSLFNGLSAGLQRQLCFSSIRIGLYDSVKTTYQKWLYGNSNGTTINSTSRILAGLTTGATAVLIAQPTDVVKVRFQAQLKGDVSNNYKTTFEAYKTIFRKEGAMGLWKGTLPNASRNAIVNVAEIVCYDIIKDKIISNGILVDATPCHFVSAVIAGFCATIVASPVDVVKTRYMNSKKGTYKSSITCALQMFKEEGPQAFFKGFTPSFCRLVSWNIVMWITFEKAKAFVQYQRHIRIVE